MPLTSICQMPYKWKWTQTLVQFSSEVHWDLYDVYVKIKVFILFKPILEQLEKVCTINYSSKTWCNLFVCLSRGFLFRLTLYLLSIQASFIYPTFPCPAKGSLSFTDIWEFRTCLKTQLHTFTRARALISNIPWFQNTFPDFI